MTRREELTRRIEAVELYVDEYSEPGLRRSNALGTLARLRGERDAMDRDQADLIRAVVEFARNLRGKIPRRLSVADDRVMTEFARHSRRLEREHVGAELLRLLEDAGVDIHGDAP